MEDVEMEEKQQTLSDLLSTTAYEALRTRATGVLDKCLLHLDEKLLNQDSSIEAALLKAYMNYLNLSIVKADLGVAVAAVIAKLEQIQSTQNNDHNPLEPLARAFKAPFIGTADIQFRNYVAACCAAYQTQRDESTAPCLTITQISGFGKSRILQRLAESTAEGELLVHKNEKFQATVLYVRARRIKGFTGYPRETAALRDWLFPEDCNEELVGAALVKAFNYAVAHPDAGKQWTKLFDNESDGKLFDADVVEELKKVELQSSISLQKTKKQKTSESRPVLIVAIDDARALLEIENCYEINALQMLCRALTTVNRSLQDVNGNVFVVLADAYPRVHEVVARDLVSRKGEGTAAFSSFVLTKTMDVMLRNMGQHSNEITAIRNRVLSTNENEVWEALVAMGRPLWRSIELSCSLQDNQRKLIALAASKLLVGLEATRLRATMSSHFMARRRSSVVSEFALMHATPRQHTWSPTS